MQINLGEGELWVRASWVRASSVQTYDATRPVIDAIREAGLNRARIRDAIQAAAPWSGAAGSIDWDLVGRNRREPRLAEVSDGRLVPLEPTPEMPDRSMEHRP